MSVMRFFGITLAILALMGLVALLAESGQTTVVTQGVQPGSSISTNFNVSVNCVPASSCAPAVAAAVDVSRAQRDAMMFDNYTKIAGAGGWCLFGFAVLAFVGFLYWRCRRADLAQKDAEARNANQQ